MPADGSDDVNGSDRLQANLFFHLLEIVLDEEKDLRGGKGLA
jgi:hypothetical protein